MAIVFAVRGDSVDARYSSGGKTPGFFTNPDGVRVSSVNNPQAGMIGTNYLDHYLGAYGRRGLIYSGQNLWSGQSFSILWRGARKSGGDPGLFSIQGASTETQGTVRMFRNSGGNLFFALTNDNGQEMLGFTSIAEDLVIDTFHDIVMTCTGTTEADGLKIYKDGTLIGSYTLPVAASVNKDKGLSTINLCMVPNLLPTGCFVEEFVIWDDVINVDALGLTGASRTQYVPVSAFDGQLTISPGALNVRQFTDYTINGVEFSGNLVIPVSTDPGESNVLEGVTYMINDSNKTGTFEALASIAEVTVYTTATSNNAQGQPVPIVKGEDRDIRLSLVRSDLTPYDLSTATAITVKLLGKYNLIQKTGVAVSIPAAGQILFNLTDAETELLKVGNNQSIEITVDVGSTRRIFIAQAAYSVTNSLTS